MQQSAACLQKSPAPPAHIRLRPPLRAPAAPCARRLCRPRVLPPMKEAAPCPARELCGGRREAAAQSLRGGFGGRKALHAADGGPLRIAFSVINAFCRQTGFLKGARGHMLPLQGSAPAGGASFILPPSAPDQVKTNRFAEADSAAARFPFAAISIAQIAGFARFWQLPHKNGKICTLRRGEEELHGVVQGEMPRLHVVIHHGEHVERAVFAP